MAHMEVDDSVVTREYKSWVGADGQTTLWRVTTFRSGWSDWKLWFEFGAVCHVSTPCSKDDYQILC